jgi:hypothetical protein
LRVSLERCLGANFTAGRGRAWEGGRAPKFGILEAGNSVLVNGVRGTRDIEGKATRVGASECWQRTSFKTEAQPFYAAEREPASNQENLT